MKGILTLAVLALFELCFAQWNVQFTCSLDVYPRVFGVHADATDRYDDAFDLPIPPPMFLFSWYFAIDDVDASQLRRDIRRADEAHDWVLVAYWPTGTTVSPVTFVWHPDSIPTAEGSFFIDTDPTFSTARNMVSSSFFTFEPLPGARSDTAFIRFIPAGSAVQVRGAISLAGLENFSGTQVILDAETTYTDSTGNFVFADVDNGTHFLSALAAVDSFERFDTVLFVGTMDVELNRTLARVSAPSTHLPPSAVTASYGTFAHFVRLSWASPSESSIERLSYDDGFLNGRNFRFATLSIDKIGALFHVTTPLRLLRVEYLYSISQPHTCSVRGWTGADPAETIVSTTATTRNGSGFFVFDFSETGAMLTDDFFVELSPSATVDSIFPVTDSIYDASADDNIFAHFASAGSWVNLADAGYSRHVWVVRVYVSDESGRVFSLRPEELDGYRIYRSTATFRDTTASGVSLVATVAASDTVFFDNTALSLTDYYYAVVTDYTDGASPISELARGRKIAVRPAADALILDWKTSSSEAAFLQERMRDYAGALITVHRSEPFELLEHFDLANYNYLFIVSDAKPNVCPYLFARDTADLNAFLVSGKSFFAEGVDFAEFFAENYPTLLAQMGASQTHAGHDGGNVRSLSIAAPLLFDLPDTTTFAYAFATTADFSADELAPLASSQVLLRSQISDPACNVSSARMIFSERAHGGNIVSSIYLGAITETPARSQLFAGIFSALDVVAQINEHKLLPQSADLLAYPNPFNAAVSFIVPSSANVTILDLAGRTVATFNATSSKCGSAREIIWCPSAENAAGVYFVHANGADFNANGKILFIK